MKVIHTEIDIEAPADRVWRTIADFPSYPEWNPFIRRIEGEPKTGARLEVELHPPGGKPMTFRPRVLRAEPGQELRWLGRLWIPGIFDGEHSLFIERFRPDRIRFFHRETFRGVLLAMMPGMIAGAEAGFRQMNEALKARVEGEP